MKMINNVPILKISIWGHINADLGNKTNLNKKK